jgi:NAD(P)-dependent dehydrogenase (short-subunit alcohol dehydrogenase family)
MTADMLVVGGTTEGGIGQAIVKRHAQWMKVLAPTVGEMDVTNPASVYSYVRENGPFTSTVYCAGIQYLDRLDALAINDVRDIFEVNVIGFISLLAELTKSQTGGKVIAISSLAGRVPMTGSIGYCSSKAALNHAVRCAARELKSDWQINAIVPATVEDTPLTTSVDQQVMDIRGWSRDELMEQERIRQPLGRRIRKDEIVDLVLKILASPAALTGSVIDLTGGA